MRHQRTCFPGATIAACRPARASAIAKENDAMTVSRRSSQLSRRSVLGLGAAASLLPAAAWAESETLRIGFLTVNTGPLAAGGKQMEEGLTLFLKDRSGLIAGRKVELITGDTAGQPANAKAKTQELVERSNVQVLIGPLATYEAMAIDEYLRQGQVPLITPTSAASVGSTGAERNPWLIHAVGTAPQVTHPLGEYAAKTLGYKRVATIADDFTYGYEGVGGFQRTFEDNGGKVVQKLWSPLNATDYGTFIAQIKRDVDAVYIGFAGVNGLRFLKQYAEYGLHGKIPVLGNTTSTDEGILRVMGDEALDVVTAGWYAATLDSPANRGFVDGIRANFGHDPGFYAAGSYTAGLFLETALTALQGDTSDPEKLRNTLTASKLAYGPIGAIRLDNFGTPVLDVHIRKVEKRNGKLVNAVVNTYHDVSQFWTYDPQKFLADPAYSRDYPPGKYLE
jgi:branched-chain amino acid transport system substrate-binding protein